ncbi:MAG: sigma-70 family RNA polymerase sigma factor [Spirochaetales bacterium]|nr:sigma-70 family RNA polymerase sigma factor [Spirochaetales bacterium]
MFLSEIEFNQLKQQDPGVFEKVYNEYKVKIFNFLIYKTRGNRDVANELFSETVYSAFASVSTLKNAKNLQGWLLLVAHRRYVDHVRKKIREKKYLEPVYHEYNKNNNNAEKLFKLEQINLLRIALGNIKENYRKVLELKYLENKSVNEITIIMNKTESAVRNMLNRARTMLKKEMVRLEKNYFRE